MVNRGVPSIFPSSSVKYDFFRFNKMWNFMKPAMRTVTNKYHEIFYSIVMAYLINMMNGLMRLKKSSNTFFNNQTVFLDISFATIRMIRSIPKHISIMMSNSAFPNSISNFYFCFWGMFSTLTFYTHDQFSCLRMFFTQHTTKTFLTFLKTSRINFTDALGAFIPRRRSFDKLSFFINHKGSIPDFTGVSI